jgi:hypothetical protein
MTEVENQEDFSHYVGALNVKRAALDLETDAQRMISWSEKWPRMRAAATAGSEPIFFFVTRYFSTHSRTGSAPIHRNACQLYLFFSRYFREISSKAYFIVSMPTNFHTLLIFELDSLFDVLIRQYKARCKYSRRHYLFTYTKIVFPAAPTLSLLNFLFGQRHQRSAQ